VLNRVTILHARHKLIPQLVIPNVQQALQCFGSTKASTLSVRRLQATIKEKLSAKPQEMKGLYLQMTLKMEISNKLFLNSLKFRT